VQAEQTRFRILSVDGGGVRGLVPVLLLRDLERRLEELFGQKRPLSDWFHMLAGHRPAASSRSG
jgi:patatin-like phospholipase/acyl hydrolase